ncbi:MAG TPA: NAD(P)-binding domain-containing protein [Anaerolineales bacterium]|nr:NAD(P)-binding domain-containing protein [Anaerolineales bacterium]
MSEVTVIGLGNMGSALARVLLDAPQGRAVTVWNRSPGKAAPLVDKGAVLAPSAAAAVAASPIIMMCVTNYAAANHILDEAAANLPGKMLVQFTTGSPQDARASETWAHEHGAEYLDCAITGSPSSIGTPSAHILVAGREAVFQKAEPTLRVLANNLDYKGESIGLASAWEMVFIMHYYGMFLSLFHSVQICQAEGILLEEYITLLGEQGQNYEKWLCENIRSGNYQDTSAPLELWAGAIKQIAQHAQDSHIDAEFPKLAARLFQEAMAAGYGREEVSALFKVLQK